MLIQNPMIARLRTVCEEEANLLAAMLYGSFVYGEADEYSDIDVILYFDDQAQGSIDQAAWVGRIAPVEMYYHNEFGNGVAIFDNLVRAEFHFDPFSTIHKLEDYRSVNWFPSPEAAILVDKTGRLFQHLSVLCGSPLVRETAEQALYVCQSFLNWHLFGWNVFQRGEKARSLEILHLVQDYLLKMVRIHENTTVHWLTPTRLVEKEISAPAYDRLRACTAPLEVDELRVAYWNAWSWGKEMMVSLAEQYNFELPEKLIGKMEQRTLL